VIEVAFSAMALNTGFWIAYFFTPGATEAFVLRVASADLLSVGQNRMKPAAGFVAGSIGDRSGIPKSAGVALPITMVSFAFFSITPADTSLPPLAPFDIAWSARSIHALQSIHFALIDQQGISESVTGTVDGAASVIGFAPDSYIPVMDGVIMDSSPDLPSYRIPFEGVGVVGVLGCVANPDTFAEHRSSAVDIHRQGHL